jgi:hypothetical protein
MRGTSGASELATGSAQHRRLSELEPADLRRARERAKALACRSLFGEWSESLRLGRYELVKTLGRGGMGTVFEAIDPVRRERVALKVLHRASATSLYHLKREFRALAELEHSNLVSLYELVANVDEPHFTMELVRGRDIVSYVQECFAEGESDGFTKLRDAFAQLANGVLVLHRAGKLHRDLKPANVLVAEDGRLVLLDFGLVHELGHGADECAGTPGYMPPEQERGRTCEASDWYSYGRILQQALAVAEESPGARAEASLSHLARRLVVAEPTARATAGDIFSALRGSAALQRTATTYARPDDPLVGRERELERLQGALRESRAGPVLAIVRGGPGVGKTALVRQFVAAASARTNTLVLHGRCHERESVSYKALDGVIDELSRALVSSQMTIELESAERAALVRMFPVLGRVPSLAVAESLLDEVPPVELRRRGVLGLKRLLSQIARTRELIVCIDDVQWSDLDSGQLLAALLFDSDAPALLIIAKDQSDTRFTSPAVEALQQSARLALTDARFVHVALEPLSRASSVELATALLRKPGPHGADEQRARLTRIVSEAGGNPRLLRELALSVADRAEVGELPAPPPTMHTILAARLRALSDEARSLLALLSVAGIPLPTRVASRAAALEQPATIVRELQRARFVTTASAYGEETLEVVHAQIEEAVLSSLERPQREQLHSLLAGALEAEDADNVEALLAQYLGAQLFREAAPLARRAGDLAFAALAFSRAASLYQKALELGVVEGAERVSLWSDLARALDHAGRALEAVAAYSAAAEGCDDPRGAAELFERAAGHLIQHGRLAEGAPLLARCYRLVGLEWHARRSSLYVSTFWRLALLCRRPSYPPRPASPIHAQRAELLSAIGSSLQTWDVARTLYNSLLVIGEAERSDDATWHVRALAVRGLLRCTGLAFGGSARGLLEVERAWREMRELGNTKMQSELDSLLSFANFVVGNARRCLEFADVRERKLRVLRMPPNELHHAISLIGAALLELGELSEAARRWPLYCHEARHHGDLTAISWVQAHPIQLALLFAHGRRAAADTILAQQRELREAHPAFPFLAWTHAICRVESELYWGDAEVALQVLKSERAALERMKYGFLAEQATALRARVCMAAAARIRDASRRETLLSRVARDARRIRRSQRASVRGSASLADAGVAFLRQRPSDAAAHLLQAVTLLDGAESKLLAACARFVLGRLRGDLAGDTLVAASRRTLLEEGIREPARWVAWSLPAFRSLLECGTGAALD